MTEEEQLGLTTSWMMRQDDAIDKANVEMALLSSKVDGLGEKVDTLTQSQQRTEDWLKTNHDTLTSLADGMRSFEKLGDMAEKVGKVLKPIFWLVTIGGAAWAWGGKLVSSALGALHHIPK